MQNQLKDVIPYELIEEDPPINLIALSLNTQINAQIMANGLCSAHDFKIFQGENSSDFPIKHNYVEKRVPTMTRIHN